MPNLRHRPCFHSALYIPPVIKICNQSTFVPKRCIGCLAIEGVVHDGVELYYSCSVYLLVSTGPVVIGGDINEQDLLMYSRYSMCSALVAILSFALCCASAMLMGCAGRQEVVAVVVAVVVAAPPPPLDAMDANGEENVRYSEGVTLG